MAEEQARRALLEAVAPPRRPGSKPVYPDRGTSGALSKPGGPGPRLPGNVPRVWNIPARNPGFAGRDRLLVAVRERLLAGDRAVVQALHGMGGVGKTQLATAVRAQVRRNLRPGLVGGCEQPGLIGEQFAALSAELGCTEPGAGMEAVRSAVLGELRERSRWLLVFDNAEAPGDISRWLPGGSGHVLVTSREPGWTEIAVPVEIDMFARTESVAILCDRVAGLAEADASQLADRLGDLPLAVAQAAGFMAQTGMPAAEYLDQLETKAARILDQAPPASYPKSLAAASQLIADQLAHTDRAASQLADLCAFLAANQSPTT